MTKTEAQRKTTILFIVERVSIVALLAITSLSYPPKKEQSPAWSSF